MRKITVLLCLICLNSTKSYINHLKDDKLAALSKNKFDEILKGIGKVNNEKNHVAKQNGPNEAAGDFKLLPSRRKKSRDRSSGTDSSSTSLEFRDWKSEWKEHWLHKKLEAINTSIPTGDSVNMAAARPWGTPCGDPNQHDVPWGTCMLASECEAEYRIYRGDYFCGRTMYICCALQLTNYDLYGGFDLSFAGSSLATDTDEKMNRLKGSKEKDRKKRTGDRKRRKRERRKRKRRIKKAIRKITRELKRILNRTFKNGTRDHKRKTRQLKKFIKQMKKKYREERKSVRDIHEVEMLKVDLALQKRLDDIRDINRQFNSNGTFRDLVINGTIAPKNVQRMAQAYPELMDIPGTRRRADRGPDYLNYDIEYGYLY